MRDLDWIIYLRKVDERKREIAMDMIFRVAAGESVDDVAASYGVMPDGKGGYNKRPWD